MLGRAQEAVNRFADAEATYRKAIEARPDDWQAYNTLGGFYGRPVAMAGSRSRRIQRVIALTPDNTRGYNNLGVTYFRMETRTRTRRVMWERSLEIRTDLLRRVEPRHVRFPPAAIYGAGGAGVRARGGAGAVRHARVAEPRRGVVLGAGGAGEGRGRRSRKSCSSPKRVRRSTRDNPPCLAQLADAHAMLGSTSEALAAATAVERLGVPDAETAFLLAGVYEELGNRVDRSSPG